MPTINQLPVTTDVSSSDQLAVQQADGVTRSVTVATLTGGPVGPTGPTGAAGATGFDGPTGPTGAIPQSPSFSIMTVNGAVFFTNLPTSADGLTAGSGQVWVDDGVLRIV